MAAARPAPRRPRSPIARSPVARAFGAVNYRVPGIISPIAQPSGMTCWATVASMMIMWKRQQSLPIETALASIGARWVGKFQRNEGLTSAEKPIFLAAAGFQSQPPMNPTIDGWANMLRRYGPLWVTTDEAPGAPFAIHARILRGISGDGTPDGTTMEIVDPAGGRMYTESFTRFQAKFEEEANAMVRDRDPRPFRVQIVHWPAGTGIAVQQAIVASQFAAPAVLPLVELGLAVFGVGHTVATSGDVAFSTQEASYRFPHTPLDTPRTRSTMEFCIYAHHPRYAISTQQFWFRLQVDHNGHDILLSRIDLLRDRSSSLHASTFSVNFRPQAGDVTTSAATIRYVIDGRWDPVGRGDVSFRGELHIGPHGAASIEIDSEEDWVYVREPAFTNVQRTRQPTPRRVVEAHELFFDPPGSDRIQPGTERTLLDWFDRLAADVRQLVRGGTVPAVIHGHASTTGDDTANRMLARRRAERVERILRDHLGSAAQLQIQAHGERGAGPDGVEDRARRKARVEITRFV